MACGLQPGDVEQDGSGVGYAEELGQSVARLIKRLEATKDMA